METAAPQTPYQRAQDRIYEILEVAAPGDTPSKIVNLSIIALVLLNAASFVLGLFPYFAPYQRYLHGFEVFSVAVFTVEYLLRLWSATASPAAGAPVAGRIRFALRPLVLVDLVAVLPFYLPMLVSVDLRILRLLRLMRLTRLVKITRYLRQPRADEGSLRELLDAFHHKLEEIRARLTADQEHDLTGTRAGIDSAIAHIRQGQQQWQELRSQNLQLDDSTRAEITAPLDRLEEKLFAETRFGEIQLLVQRAYVDSAVVFAAAPEWASVEIDLNWKDIKSYKRVPIRRIGTDHLSQLENLHPGACARFRQVYTDRLRQSLGQVRASINYVLAQGSESADQYGEVQAGLNRAVNRLRDLDEPVHTAWENLGWNLQEEHQHRLQRVDVDIDRYGSPLFYLGRLFRTLRRLLRDTLQTVFHAVAGLAPLVGQRLAALNAYLFERLKPLLQWIGLARPPALEVLQTLDEARLDSVRKRGLPADYLAHFYFSALADEHLFVGFEEELATIDQAIRRWENGLASTFLIHGQRGSGKTSLLNLARQRLFKQEHQVIQASVGQKITSAGELVAYLSNLLDLPGAGDSDALAKSLLSGPRRAVLLEGCHDLFLRRIGGLEAFQHLLWLVARTNHHVLWGLCMGKYADGYLEKCFPLNALFHFELAIPPLRPETLRRLIMARHNQSGYRLHYLGEKRLEKILRRRVKRWTHLEEPAVQEALEQIFFERLADVCGENIVVAFFYWLRSLHPTGEDSFEVAPMQELDLDLVRGFSMDQAYLLNALLQHDNLTARELASILDSGLIQTRLEIEILVNQNILDMGEKGFFRVNPVALKPVAQMLESRNLIY